MKNIIIALSLILFIQSSATAATITAVKNGKTLINLDGDEVAEGDEFFLINPATNKKVGIIRVKQVKNGKALAEILKGRADVGYSLRAKASSGAGAVAAARSAESETAKEARSEEPTEGSDRTPRDTSYLRYLKPSFGVLGELLQNTMTVSIKDYFNATESVALKGTSFGAGGFYEFIATPDISVRALVALEQYNASGTSSILGCDGKTSTNCSANIMYLSAYGLGKYYFTQSRLRFWGGAGGGFLVAVSKSATALNESNIATNQILTLAIGGDWQVSRKNYIPFSIEYNYFPPSDTVKATSIVLKAGWAWNAN